MGSGLELESVLWKVLSPIFMRQKHQESPNLEQMDVLIHASNTPLIEKKQKQIESRLFKKKFKTNQLHFQI